MLPFTVQLPILCAYFSNYWVITSTNPKPNPVPCTYLTLPSTLGKYTISIL